MSKKQVYSSLISVSQLASLALMMSPAQNDKASRINDDYSPATTYKTPGTPFSTSLHYACRHP